MASARLDQHHMSRLDSFIRRLEAQRTVLNWAAKAIEGREGLVLELGLGNGRTFDHLARHSAGAGDLCLRQAGQGQSALDAGG